jgi:hypothetical protein
MSEAWSELLKPIRPRLEQLQKQADAIQDVASWWAELMPEANAKRRFASLESDRGCPAPGDLVRSLCSTPGCIGCDPERVIAGANSHPPTRRACVALASDPEGVRAVEELAQQFVANMKPWGVPQPRWVVWRCLQSAVLRPCDPRLREPIREAYNHEVGLSFIETDDRPAAVRLGIDVETFRFARTSIATMNLSPTLRPLGAIWNCGYALDAVTDEAVVLVASSIRPSPILKEESRHSLRPSLELRSWLIPEKDELTPREVIRALTDVIDPRYRGEWSKCDAAMARNLANGLLGAERSIESLPTLSTALESTSFWWFVYRFGDLREAYSADATKAWLVGADDQRVLLLSSPLG